MTPFDLVFVNIDVANTLFHIKFSAPDLRFFNIGLPTQSPEWFGDQHDLAS